MYVAYISNQGDKIISRLCPFQANFVLDELKISIDKKGHKNVSCYKADDSIVKKIKKYFSNFVLKLCFMKNLHFNYVSIHTKLNKIKF